MQIEFWDNNMNKILTCFLIIIFPICGFGENLDIRMQMIDREILNLYESNQRDQAELERCAESVKGFKVAGIITLSLTGAGIVTNIAQANNRNKLGAETTALSTTLANKNAEIEQKQKAEAEKAEREAVERAEYIRKEQLTKDSVDDNTKEHKDDQYVDKIVAENEKTSEEFVEQTLQNPSPEDEQDVSLSKTDTKPDKAIRDITKFHAVMDAAIKARKALEDRYLHSKNLRAGLPFSSKEDEQMHADFLFLQALESEFQKFRNRTYVNNDEFELLGDNLSIHNRGMKNTSSGIDGYVKNTQKFLSDYEKLLSLNNKTVSEFKTYRTSTDAEAIEYAKKYMTENYFDRWDAPIKATCSSKPCKIFGDDIVECQIPKKESGTITIYFVFDTICKKKQSLIIASNLQRQPQLARDVPEYTE